eukprot:TRINITY_DN23195_c0_g1_i1.p1 TRINITY_DN23195_c0_g1~~TRINITY_DN23195_c0_g1_i1.p1  ORF type:complete len:188 (-),score=-13.67 TRINITY_DN23195_c0_g1_i1:63-626(-)
MQMRPHQQGFQKQIITTSFWDLKKQLFLYSACIDNTKNIVIVNTLTKLYTAYNTTFLHMITTCISAHAKTLSRFKFLQINVNSCRYVKKLSSISYQKQIKGIQQINFIKMSTNNLIKQIFFEKYRWCIRMCSVQVWNWSAPLIEVLPQYKIKNLKIGCYIADIVLRFVIGKIKYALVIYKIDKLKKQ